MSPRGHERMFADHKTLRLPPGAIGPGGSANEPFGLLSPVSTVTVAGTSSTETVTVTETDPATKAERAKLKERAEALAQRKSLLAARERKVHDAEKELQLEIGVVKRNRFSDGTFIVGKEVTPGTYRARGGGSCYWARPPASVVPTSSSTAASRGTRR